MAGARPSTAATPAVTVHIGTSGWQYADWRPAFYPAGLATDRWLEFYAAAFGTVESNNAFYRLPDRAVFAAWAARTPPDFRVAVKMSRYLTHVLRLREPRGPVARFFDHARGLGEKLGPVLLQLPPTLRADRGRLAAVLDEIPADARIAVEFRHPSWFSDEIRQLLQRRGAALCLADRRGPVTPIWRTADWTYLRLHEGRAAPWPCYGRAALASWVTRIAATWSAAEDVYVYCNNDPGCCAVANAATLAAAVQRAGLQVTRVPAPPAVNVVRPVPPPG